MRLAVALCVVSVAAAACGGSSSTAPSSTSGNHLSGSNFPLGPLALTHSIIDPGAIRWITPLGNLNPTSHTLPTDHIYFYVANPNAGESPVTNRTTFFAPGNGTVTFVIGGAAGQESKIIVRQTSTHSYYVDHVILSSAVSIGTVVTAGQVLGTTGSVYAVDLGVINDSLTVSFINPAHYTDGDSLHADAPLQYYVEPVRSQLYAKVQRLGAELDGIINYDRAGTLAGNWFPVFGNLPLSFAYDTYDPSLPLISIGIGAFPGVFAMAPGDPLPRNVTIASGRVLYALYRTQSGPGRTLSGNPFWMLVQMTDDTHLRAEIFATRPTDFTASTIAFIR